MHHSLLLYRASIAGMIVCAILSLYHWSRAAERLAPDEGWWVPFVNVQRGDPMRYQPAGRPHLRRSKIYGALFILCAVAKWASS
jgi:hypothetical protein